MVLEVFSVFVIERQELIKLRLNCNQFMFALWINPDSLNPFHGNRFVVNPKHLLFNQEFHGFRDPNSLVGIVGPLCVTKLAYQIGVIGYRQECFHLLLIP